MANRYSWTSLFIAILLVVAIALAGASKAAEYEGQKVYTSGKYSYFLDDRGALIIKKYLGSDSHIDVPESIDSMPVKGIGVVAFFGLKNLSSINLPENLESIGDRSFSYCEGLKEINLPEGLKSIGEEAFSECIRLESLSLPNSLETIKANPFTNTYVRLYIDDNHPYFELIDGALIEKSTRTLVSYPYEKQNAIYKVPEGTFAIGPLAFYGSESLKSVALPEGVKAIGERAFHDCKNLVSIELPDSLEVIGEWAFYACHSLDNVALPEGLKLIDERAFENCFDLRVISFPNSLETIVKNPFVRAPINISIDEAHPNFELIDGVLLERATKTLVTYPFGKKGSIYKVPDGVLAIGDGAFTDSRRLTSIGLPEGLEIIEDKAFSYCRNLKHIVWPSSLKSIGDSGFSTCESLEKVSLPEGLEVIGDGAFYDCIALAKVSLPKSLKSLGDSAFSYCEKLKAIALPKSLETITGNPFTDANIRIDMDSDHPHLELIEGVLFHKATKTLISYPYSKRDSTYIVPEGVLKIGKGAFADGSYLKTLVLPEGINTIEDHAFFWCGNLKAINLPKSLEYMGDKAFWYTSFDVITLSRGSYAEGWVKEKELAFRYED